MGCDGGTIPTRDELVTLKKKPEQKDKDGERVAKWKHCQLSQEPLQKPIVACELGMLYNKTSILEFLIDKSKFNVDKFSHIRTLKDVKLLNLSENPASSKGPVDKSADYICPVTGLEMSGKWRYMVATQLDTAYAREMFPCMDDPGLKARFSMSIWRKSPMVSLFNMPQNGDPDDRGNGWVIDHFDSTPPMATYLLAIIVGEYKSKSSPSKHGHIIKIWGPVEYINNGYADYPSEITGPAMDYYDDLFGYKYPLPKLDIALVPDKNGATEDWGLVVSGNYAAMFDPSINGENQKRRHSDTMYHELTHLWYGDLVTLEWWSDVWVNEAFATFYAPFPWTRNNPDWDMHKFFEESCYSFIAYEETGTRHAAHNPSVTTKVGTTEMYTTISYGRTAMVLRMMRNLVMTNEQWDEAMKIYLKDNEYGSAVYKEVFAAIDKVTRKYGLDKEVSPSTVLDTYIRQMGHPVVTITTRENTKFVEATQKLFLQDDHNGVNDQQNPSPFRYKWEVPIKYITNRDTNNSNLKWLHQTNDFLELKYNITEDDWILANHEHNGFFRVNYNAKNWNALIKQLDFDHTVLTEFDKGALISDAFQLARAGEIDYSIALRLTTYLKHETSFLPFAALLYAFNFFGARMTHLESYGSYKQYIRETFRPLHSHLGWKAVGNETEKFISMRLRRYAMDESCGSGNTHCIEEAVNIVTQYKNDPTNHKIVDPDMQVTIFCTAVKYETGSELWNFIWNLFNNWLHDDMKEERRDFLRDALYCTRKHDDISRLFSAVMGDQTEISYRDRNYIANGIARNPVGQHIVQGYLNSHWSDGHPFQESLLRSLTDNLDTIDDLLKAQEMMKSLNIDVMNPALYSTVIDTITRNQQFRLANGHIINDFFFEATLDYRPKEVPGETLLPRHLVPTNYDLHLAPDFYHTDPADFKSWGYVKISFSAVNESDVVFLHYRYIDIDHTSVIANSLTKDLALHIERVQVIKTAADSVLGIYLSREVAAGENITVEMDFTNIIRDNVTKAGLYWNVYHDRDLNPKFMLGTQLQATAADWIFPCMDEVGLQATFTIHMSHKTGLVAQSNMPQSSQDETITSPKEIELFSKYGISSDGWMTTHFQPSPVMQPYLLSLAISDFTSKQAPYEYNKFNVKIWAQRKFIEDGFGDYAANVSGMQMDFFSETFQYDYPLPKQDSIVVPDRTGAMENWGLITYAGYYMLIDPQLSDAFDYWQVARVIAHEQAHLVRDKF